MTATRTIYYTKHFETGILKGLEYIDSITFDETRIDEMVNFMCSHKYEPVKPAAGSSGYTITDFSFQSYKR